VAAAVTVEAAVIDLLPRAATAELIWMVQHYRNSVQINVEVVPLWVNSDDQQKRNFYSTHI